jgi:hypothetical protein
MLPMKLLQLKGIVGKCQGKMFGRRLDVTGVWSELFLRSVEYADYD